MLEPGVAHGSSLIAQGAHEIGSFVVICDDQAAFARGDLFIGIESKYAVVPKGPGRLSFIFTAESLARIFDYGQVILFRNGIDLIIVRRLAEHIHRQQRLQRTNFARIEFGQFSRHPFPGRFAAQGNVLNGFPEQIWVNIARNRIDIHKDRDRPFKEDHIRRSHEGEWRGDHQIAGANPAGAHAKVQARRPGVHANGMFAAGEVAKRLFKTSYLGSHA